VLVDAGLFQGLKELRLRNWEALSVPAETIDAVVLTHAHLDHCGYLPRLVAQGFRGRVFCTPGTKELCSIILPDAARLQEEDAHAANRGGYSRHTPALPLFTEADAFRALSVLQPLGYERSVPVVPGVDVDFINAGHLLGSAYARVRLAGPGLTVLFGGDLGRYNRPVLPDPSLPPACDVLLVESTYGNRTHERDDDGEHLARLVREVADRKSKLVIPAFAVGRVQEVLYWLKKLEDGGRVPILPVYLDSPMAAEALRFYQQRASELDPLPPADEPPNGRRRQERDVCRFCTAKFQVVTSPQQSRELVASHGPVIVVSSSGMATGGRVLHHLKAALPDARNIVLFVGYQAEATRGRQLVDGARAVRIHGQDVPVAARVERIDSMSAHADSEEILRWLTAIPQPPRQTYLVHGEVPAMEALAAAIRQQLHWTVAMPDYRETVQLGS
jgi:metallo-beta-lactamase family protein